MEELKIDSDDISYDDIVSKAAFENFGIKYLFPWQRLVVANIMEAYNYQLALKNLSEEEKKTFQQENNDSFCLGRQIVLLPTGAGKSLCFQIPALLFNGPSLIIYPLLALMTDQQRRMEEGSLRSVTFRGGQSEEERKTNFQKIKDGAKIILANPEVLQSEELLEQLKNVGILHIAIDEAHCVAEWGDSFRPAYLGLGNVIKVLNPPVITAFTATASPSVLNRVSEILFNGEAHVVRSESDRQNIHYFVKYAAEKKKKALFLVKTELKPMIIFCGTRNNAEEMSLEINNCFGNEKSKFYHAGLEKTEKEVVEKWFYESKDGVLCATCAYGMGVDKKDIKTVVHIVPSATAEAYIQEAGRGGRDGSVAKAILIWSLEDSNKYSVYKSGSREAAMREFAETKDCRRQVLLDALGAEKAVCSGCDLCNKRIDDENIKKMKFIERNKCLYFKRKLEQIDFTDWNIIFKMIKNNPNFYTKTSLETKITKKMNNEFAKTLSVNIWNHSDSADLIRQLALAEKIREASFLWKKKLKINRKKCGK